MRVLNLKEGNDYVGRSKEWGEEQFRAYNTAHYHQPSDEIRDTWDYRGMIQEGEIALAIGRMISDAPEKPRLILETSSRRSISPKRHQKHKIRKPESGNFLFGDEYFLRYYTDLLR